MSLDAYLLKKIRNVYTPLRNSTAKKGGDAENLLLLREMLRTTQIKKGGYHEQKDCIGHDTASCDVM
jgi:hypothetical protein